MAIFKCKICGGSLEIDGTQSVAICEYCGTKQTLPKLDSERRANLYDRANHFRRNNDFDKAMGIYENILNEDNTDAEAYWSLVLCRYGIEYVEDPVTRKRVQTVNRAQFTSIFDDEDYKSAIANADGYQREIYEAEATAINEIQKGILAISQKEEPFDVFICYKETDNHGRRTQDSVLATELYHELTREGFNVFFSRITLEDKLGVAYEPYIFAALHSAKVMVVLGTRPEHFNAVWVKNEWSRFLALIKNGAKKTLIPAYRDMDPYDLPEEFSHLQAQDMSKLGFMQDLIRGIKKIVVADSTKEAIVIKEPIQASVNTNISPLIKRMFIFLEDEDWESANEYSEKVLDQDPENAQAYLGKLMIKLRVRKQEELRDCKEPFDDNGNYQRAVRFGDESLRASLIEYIEYINTRNKQAKFEAKYVQALRLMNMFNVDDYHSYREAASLFSEIKEYKDSKEKAEFCLKKAEEIEYEEKYRFAMERIGWFYKFKSISYLEDALYTLKKIKGYKDSEELLKKLGRELFIAKEEQAKFDKKVGIIISSSLCVLIAFIIVLVSVIIPNNKYNDAVALMDAGKYGEAIYAFEALDGYRDSANKIETIYFSQYMDAVALMNEGKYSEAIDAFETLDGYIDSINNIERCNTAILDGKYNDAIALMDAGKYSEAISAFEAMDGYKDSISKIEECNEECNNINIYGEDVWNKIKTVNVGDIYSFGSYEQDNNKSNGQENIEWLVLAKDGTKILVISKYALDCKPYNTRDTGVTWETCTLREWLNSDFINAAFSADEKAMIPAVTVSADKNPNYRTNPGNTTQDKVFLLSITEVNKYFSSYNARECEPTDYADSGGAYVSTYNGNCWWWLRSPGYSQYRAAVVDDYGDVNEYGRVANCLIYAVRPALWIDLNA